MLELSKTRADIVLTLVGFAKNTAVVNHGPENEKEEEKLVQRLTGWRGVGKEEKKNTTKTG